jgi:hypothetical protein
MKRLEVSHTVQVFANIGVIAGLVFLGYELRQTRLAIEDSSHLSSVMLSQGSFDRLWEPGFASLYQGGLEAFDALDESQRLQFDAYVSQRLNLWEYAFYSYSRGTMDEELWRSWDASFRGEIRQEAWLEIWHSVASIYGESFRAHVDSILADE